MWGSPEKSFLSHKVTVEICLLNQKTKTTHLRMNSPATFGDLATQLGSSLLGLLLGELLHRLLILIEELPYLKDRYKSSPAALIQAVFSHCHWHALSAPLLLCLGLGLVVAPSWGYPHLALPLLRTILSVALVYVLLRIFGAMDNSLEDMQVLEEKNALLGPGLATNYWFSFLKWLLVPVTLKDAKGNKFENLQEACMHAQADTEPQDDYKEDAVEDEQINPDGQMIARLALDGSDFRIFKKIIILLPSSCNLKISSVDALKAERVFIHCAPDVDTKAPKCTCDQVCSVTCHHVNCSHNFRFEVERVQRRPPIKMTVHWIYEREEDEVRDQGQGKGDGRKIFVMFDFPMLLQSAMGPGREMADKPAARAKNMDTFQDTVADFLASNDYSRFRELVTFHPYKVEGEEEDRRSLSAELRERVLADEGQVWRV